MWKPTMTKPKLSYFEQEDILHLIISEEEEANSLELSPNITAELNEKGELIGIEILNASTFVRDTIMEGGQAKGLQLNPGRKEAGGTAALLGRRKGTGAR